MLITHIEPIVIAVPFAHGGPTPRRSTGMWERMESLLVRIDTDAGISGWGEAFGFSAVHVTSAAIKHVLAPLCMGRDPEQLPELMGMLKKSTQNLGSSGPLRYACAGIELALWDIAGKIRQQPLAQMLGGAKHTRIPTYASFLPYHDVALVERNVGECLDRGYKHIKLHEKTVETVAAARRIGGDGLTLMLDVNCAWNLAEAAGMARSLEPFGLTWLEEPISPPDDFEAHAALRAQTSIPIAIGENVGNLREVRRAIAEGAFDILQPDAIKLGGVVEMIEAMQAAKTAGLRAIPHSPFFGPAIIATLHAIATFDETIWCERFYCELDAYVLGDAVAVVDGMMNVPQGPGLGIRVDEKLVERFRIA